MSYETNDTRLEQFFEQAKDEYPGLTEDEQTDLAREWFEREPDQQTFK